LLLESIFNQTYPRQNIEVIIADGLSTDQTREEIRKFMLQNQELSVKVVDNPKRSIPSALNQALNAAAGDFIVRLDAHSLPAEDYVSRSIADLQAGLGDNVGGMWKIQPGSDDWQARSIALAAAHPLGVGDARYRVGGRAQTVDTVPFGAFDRSLIDRIGLFDETLLTNEDYEFNTRIRQAGGKIWFDPEIKSQYIARRSLAELARQYWRYGFWKVRMLRQFPESFRWRQLAGLFVLSFPVLGLLGIWFSWAAWFLILEIGLYLLALFFTGLQLAIQQGDLALLWGVPLAIATMHFSWGTAFIWSMIRR
jgi:glycosyltransferase involved in cell wall biosynthesis